MSALDLSVVFGLIAAFTWGFSDFFAARASKSIGPVLSIFAIALLGVPLYVVIYLISGVGWHFNITGDTYAVCSGMVYILSNILFFKALEDGPVSLVSPISSTYPLVTTILALLVFGSHLTLGEILGIILIILGVSLASGLLETNKKQRHVSRGVKLAIGASIVWGLAFALTDQAIKRLGWLNSGLIETFSYGAFSLVFVPLFKGKEEISFKRFSLASRQTYILLNVLVGMIGTVAIFIALSKSKASGGAVAAAASSMYPILTMALALKHLKEKVKFSALVGAFIRYSWCSCFVCLKGSQDSANCPPCKHMCYHNC